MNERPAKITLDGWDRRYDELRRGGLVEPPYGGPLRRHVEEGGDRRLLNLKFDNSPAALRLWNFLLTEEDRLFLARDAGKRIVASMKDLGTVPVMACSLPDTVAFYPDGAWWIPCVMEMHDASLAQADALGFDESFCPVRAMLGAMLSGEHYPRPDLLTCAVGATCDDFSAIAQRLEGLGYPILWWELPARRKPEAGEDAVALPGGFSAPAQQVEFVKSELQRVRQALEAARGMPLTDEAMADGIRAANKVRRLLGELRRLAYSAGACPMPALEMLIAEMLAIHFCSDRAETIAVLTDLLAEARRRAHAGAGVLSGDAVGVFWVNPVADLRVMNLLEDCGGRIAGSDYMFCHALEEIPEDLPAMEALARTALADPMAGSSSDRAEQICRGIRLFGARAAVVCRIPGASHCAFEGAIICDEVRSRLGIPAMEIEVPPVSDAMLPTLRTRLEALIEAARSRRK